MKRFLKTTLLLIVGVVLMTLSSCSSHPQSTISIDHSLDYASSIDMDRGGYFRCGSVDLYRKKGNGWREVVYCTLWGKVESMGSTSYYVAINNDSIYESDWVMSRIRPSNRQGEYQVSYGGETLYCWGDLSRVWKWN